MAALVKCLIVGNTKVAIKETLGRGAFGVVYRVKMQGTSDFFALKDIPCTNKSAIDDAIAEVQMLRKLKHHNIVQIVDAYRYNMRDGVHILILTEFCSGGNLNERLDRQPNNETPLKWMKQLANALTYLHGKGIVHRDLKPENVLLSNSSDENIKIGDFGLAHEYVALIQSSDDVDWLVFYITHYMHTFAGSLPWMAPEVFNYRYSEKADIFSLGCIFHAILVRDSVEFDGKRYYGAFVSGKGLGYAMAKAKVDLTSKAKCRLTSTSRRFQEIINDTLKLEPDKRPTARQLCEKLATQTVRLTSQPTQSVGGCCW